MEQEAELVRLISYAPRVHCPGCLVEMNVRKISPAHRDMMYCATYRCPECGTDTIREFTSGKKGTLARHLRF
jgi:transposase-like protein